MLAVFVSGISGGFILAYLLQLKQLRVDMQERITEFSDVTKRASEANVSLGEKLIQVDQRLDNIEAWRSMMSLNMTKR